MTRQAQNLPRSIARHSTDEKEQVRINELDSSTFHKSLSEEPSAHGEKPLLIGYERRETDT